MNEEEEIKSSTQKGPLVAGLSSQPIEKQPPGLKPRKFT
jgi:hypothetical protein